MDYGTKRLGITCSQTCPPTAVTTSLLPTSPPKKKKSISSDNHFDLWNCHIVKMFQQWSHLQERMIFKTMTTLFQLEM